MAAHKLVQMRYDLHKHGVGMLRIKMLRLKNEPQRGIMATIVKKKEFQELWELIEREANVLHQSIKLKVY